jgi:polyisoprenoid-binding protein YceI
LSFSGGTTINRSDWDLTWNQAIETGGVLVGDRIDIALEVSLVRD